jgi:phage tail sheath gpL-like
LADVQIQFNTIPSSFRIPGVGIETSTVNANTYIVNPRTLIIGQMTSNGTATPNVPFLTTSVSQVQAAAGYGSMASYMYANYQNVDSIGEVWVLPVADANSAVAATMTVSFTGNATQASTLNLYVCGDNQQVGVNMNDTPAIIANNVAVAINTGSPLPVVANASSGVLTITARNKGIAAGDIDVRLNFLGSAAGEVTPPGITLAIANGVSGTADPDLAGALANLGTKTFDYVCTAYSGPTQVVELQNMFSDSNGRWSYLSQLYGGAFNAYRGTVGALQTYGSGVDNQHISTLGFYDCPQPAYVVASLYAATCANSLRVDPGVPLQYLVIQGMMAPPPQSRFSITSRNTMLYTGISTFTVNDANECVLERAVTNYQYDPGTGEPSNAYLNVETLYCLTAYYRNFIQDMLTKFGRKKLVADGTTIPAGQPNFVSSQTIKNEVILNYRSQATTGLVTSPDVFAQNVAAQNQGNGRVAVYLPIILCNQLRRIDATCAFQLS